MFRSCTAGYFSSPTHTIDDLQIIFSQRLSSLGARHCTGHNFLALKFALHCFMIHHNNHQHIRGFLTSVVQSRIGYGFHKNATFQHSRCEPSIVPTLSAPDFRSNWRIMFRAVHRNRRSLFSAQLSSKLLVRSSAFDENDRFTSSSSAARQLGVVG